MKKTLLLALALVVSASFGTIEAAKKKKDKKKDTTIEALLPVTLTNGSDTLSYAAGAYVTEGLISYLQNQLKVDTAYMADFVQGFNEQVKVAQAAKGNAAETARLAGAKIAIQLVENMIPGISKEFTDTPDSIVEEAFFRGFTDALRNDTTVMTFSEANTVFKKKQESNKAAKAEKLTKPGREFLAENKTKEGVITTPSGLQYMVLTQGEGEVPQKTDKVKVHYEGRLIDGTVFDASSKHGTEPATFRPDQVIAGWTEALTMMPVGSKWRLFIPQNLAYGERAQGQIPAYSTLIFDVELVGIDK